MAHLSPKTIIYGDSLFTEFKGALTENFVAQELMAHLGQSLFYWKSASEAEVDFLIEHEGTVIPLEVKSGISVHSKSLKEYQKRFHPHWSVRVSPLNLQRQKELINCPLYFLGAMLKWLSKL
jgi:predicted AAA+ superfamily ATPase